MIHADTAAEGGSPVDNTMTDGANLIEQTGVSECRQCRRDGTAVVSHLHARAILGSALASKDEVSMAGVGLPVNQRGGLGKSRIRIEYAEFDAAGTGVDNEDAHAESSLPRRAGP